MEGAQEADEAEDEGAPKRCEVEEKELGELKEVKEVKENAGLAFASETLVIGPSRWQSVCYLVLCNLV